MRHEQVHRTVARVASLVLVGVLTAVAADYAAAKGATEHVWISPLGFLAEDPQTTISQFASNPQAIEVAATTTGDHVVQLGLTLLDGTAIGVGAVKPFQVTGVQICYQVVEGATVGTQISSGSLQTMTTPTASTAEDLSAAAFPLTSSTGTCTAASVTSPFKVGGAQTLELVLHFADTGAKIRLGAIRVDLQVLSR